MIGLKYIGLFLFSFLVRNVNSYSQYDGIPAIPHSAPYLVSLRWTMDIKVTPSHYCAGSILNEYWVLTTADCIVNFGRITIVAGDQNITLDEGVEQYRSIDEKPIIHELYRSVRWGPYDIALIQITKPFQFNKNVQPIELADFESIPQEPFILYGWSSTDLEDLPDVLQTTNRTLVTLTKCRTLLNSDYVHETNFCMGPTDPKNEACVVDKGGPIVEKKNGKTILIGLSSWRSMKCWPGPYVNTRVSAFIDWIYVNMAKKDKLIL